MANGGIYGHIAVKNTLPENFKHIFHYNRVPMYETSAVKYAAPFRYTIFISYM